MTRCCVVLSAAVVREIGAPPHPAAMLGLDQEAIAGKMKLTVAQPFPARNSTPIGPTFEVKSYGILGSSNKEQKADPPNEDTILVDPAGLPFIRGDKGPRDAKGAAQANYKWLEINEAESFPQEVKEAITGECHAKYYAYANGKKKCIHVVGPDFRQTSDGTVFTLGAALDKLAIAYHNVLEEFCTVGMTHGLKKMRLLPISGGIFIGPFKEDLPKMTALAVQAAYKQLSDDKKRYIMKSSIEMCIFMEAEYDLFAFAFKEGRRLENDDLPVDFVGSPRSRRILVAYTTSVYDSTGNKYYFPDDIFEKLEREIFHISVQRDSSGSETAEGATRPGSEKLHHFQYDELWLNLKPQLERGEGRWSRTAPTTTFKSPEEWVYVRFFTKGNHIRTVTTAMWPAMMYSIDVYNSFTFFFQATQLRELFVVAIIFFYLLTWAFAFFLAHREMRDDFTIQARSENQIVYSKNELGVKPRIPNARVSCFGQFVTCMAWLLSCLGKTCQRACQCVRQQCQRQTETRRRLLDAESGGGAEGDAGAVPNPSSPLPLNEQDLRELHFWKMLSMLALSYVLTTPRTLVELVLHTHCRGEHPGKGAGKLLGSRVTFATWMSKDHFQLLDQRGLEYIVPLTCVSKCYLLLIQFAIWGLTTDNKLLIQICFKLVTVVYLIRRWCKIRAYQKSLFQTASARWLQFLCKKKAQVHDPCPEGARRDGCKDISMLDLPNLTIPTKTRFDEKDFVSRAEYLKTIQDTLRGGAIKGYMKEDASGEQFTEDLDLGPKGWFPAYLSKLWEHVFSKHFPYCLGKKFSYNDCYRHVHWIVPKFNEPVRYALYVIVPVVLLIFSMLILQVYWKLVQELIARFHKD